MYQPHTHTHTVKYLMKVSEQLTVPRRDAVLFMGYLCRAGRRLLERRPACLKSSPQNDVRDVESSRERLSAESRDRCVSSRRPLAVSWLLSAGTPDVMLLQWDFSAIPRGDPGAQTLLNQCSGCCGRVAAAAGGGALHLCVWVVLNLNKSPHAEGQVHHFCDIYMSFCSFLFSMYSNRNRTFRSFSESWQQNPAFYSSNWRFY